MKYPLARQGVFRTIQGEGSLMGQPMIFIRLAGCSIGCPLCDTDYKVHERIDRDDIVIRCKELMLPDAEPWVWITGGEPTDHDLIPMANGLFYSGFRIAVATAGHKLCSRTLENMVSFWSVSPHDPSKWVASPECGELKVIPGLNGFSLKDFGSHRLVGGWRCSKWVIPCDGKPETVQECVEWVEQHPDWKLGVQAHKAWGLA